MDRNKHAYILIQQCHEQTNPLLCSGINSFPDASNTDFDPPGIALLIKITDALIVHHYLQDE